LRLPTSIKYYAIDDYFGPFPRLGMYTVRVEAEFAAAHFLAFYKGKCENMHGHNYRVRAFAAGETLDESGMLVDFSLLKKVLREVVETLDHRCLNEIDVFKNSPSAERIAEHIFAEMSKKLAGIPLTAVEVFESNTSMARYTP
jgi:6-pyruvoyltetrahydropterin/6-carboxytetrahydropterin synthase